ncbi:hypothetical protein EW145_g588 [Phellinidium pouzarii]|uniref:RRM domain-containing protein n=1 Tax=Phellinidium pouzarii TaxID=167371 RepID=A0A4S4LHT7_9AGAM|nr:hypothetical protein EW145_g588 [Phellinidium pouzarii]
MTDEPSTNPTHESADVDAAADDADEEVSLSILISRKLRAQKLTETRIDLLLCTYLSGKLQQEILAMKTRLEEIEKEAATMREMREAQEREAKAIAAVAAAPADPDAMETEDDRQASDDRSVYVGNVDYSASPEEIQAHFQSCGTINRVTILCDKFTGHPKGYAYVEFADPAFVETAVSLHESLFKGRLIKVTMKRTNIPGFTRGRGRGGFRGAYRGGGRGGGYGYQPYRARGRGRGRGQYA